MEKFNKEEIERFITLIRDMKPQQQQGTLLLIEGLKMINKKEKSGNSAILLL